MKIKIPAQAKLERGTRDPAWAGPASTRGGHGGGIGRNGEVEARDVRQSDLHLARRSSKSRLSVTDFWKVSITLALTRYCDGTTLCK